jgi:hypothetical protein
LDSTGSGQGPVAVAGCCEYSDEPSGSCVMELVIAHFNCIDWDFFTAFNFIQFFVIFVRLSFASWDF